MAVAQRGRPVRKDMFRISLTVNGENWGVWDNKTGGDVDSDQGSSYKPGGMGPPIALGGSVTTTNLVLERLCTLEDDWRRLQNLINAAGKGKAVVKQSALDPDGNAFDSNPLTFLGKVKLVGTVDHDSNSTDVALVRIEIVPDGVPTMIGGDNAARIGP